MGCVKIEVHVMVSVLVLELYTIAIYVQVIIQWLVLYALVQLHFAIIQLLNFYLQVV